MYVAKPPNIEQIAQSVEPRRLVEALSAPQPSEYVHWEHLRHREPPQGLTPEEWWWSVKWRRDSMLRDLPLYDAGGDPFVYALPDEAQRRLHYIDKQCSGMIAMPEVVIGDAQAKQHYLVNSLMEEAIRSSQLEGATTSRRVAKELLRSGRAPRNRSERMILNNYVGLQFMRDKGETLEPETVLQLQKILTDGTLRNPDSAGRLQRPDEERIVVVDRVKGHVIHRPPPAEQLPERLERLCKFASGEANPESFMHPVVRAILVHFMLGYDHPFEDGNGRTARALFYWSMRTQGYWLTEYLTISKILRNAPGKYARAFLHTETDEGDTTYFLMYQLGVIERAVKYLMHYLQRKNQEIAETERRIRRSDGFNHRQLALLGEAIRNADQTYTYHSHAVSHNVTHETSRRDLIHLQNIGLLERKRVGKKLVFAPPLDLSHRLKHVA